MGDPETATAPNPLKLDGKISSTRLAPINVSTLNAYKGTNKNAGKKLQKQQSSLALMNVENGSQRAKTGGGREMFLSGPDAAIIGEMDDGPTVSVETNPLPDAFGVDNIGGVGGRGGGDGGDAGGGGQGGGGGGGGGQGGGGGGTSMRRRTGTKGSMKKGVDNNGNEDAEALEGEDFDDDEMDGHSEAGDAKPKGIAKQFKELIRKMGCAGSKDVHLKSPMPVVVFGATGTVGGEVARALLRDHRFAVRAVTRTPTTDQARALAEEGAVVVTADLNDSRSLMRVMEGAAGVFLSTNYWEHLNKQKEITHGMNAIDAAVSCNIHHFIFHGSEPTRQDEKPCGYMEAKAALEEYVRETTLPYTAVRFPFLYENLLSLFKPHLVRPGVYTLPIPMEDTPMDCMALHDIGRCVVNIFLRPRNHMQKAVSLTGDRMTIQHMADIMKKHFDDRKIIYHKISPADFGSFDFQGCQDIAALFENMQASPARDPRVTRRISHCVTSLDKWTTDHKAKLVEVMNGGPSQSPR
ncbi:nmrA-like family domain-containing protein 1 [Aplysia californica]|uniref:NmrA-like family domain-containing protein 1 n=1 Tax=Aplysia californica TaxID=6500 RepID=A0ABM1VR21_APLCA|nr:nmrA-like family domain-containing protein 1 [Aplysia californica]